MFDFTGKTALVTGASGGLGGAIARTLHGQGATVVLSGTRAEALESLGNMVPFYATPARPALPEPEPARIPARFAGRYTAPVHSLPED